MICIRRPALNWQTDKSPASVAAAPAEVFTRILQRASWKSGEYGILSTGAELAKQSLADIKDDFVQWVKAAGLPGRVQDARAEEGRHAARCRSQADHA